MSSEVTVEMYGSRWKRYPAYRDSGVEWLGEVPEGWELLRTKQLAKRIQTGSTPPTQERHYYENGSVPWFGPGSFSTDLLLDKPIKVISKIAVKDGVARIFKGQSTMIVTIGATIGKVGYIESSASSNQQITVVTFDITRANPKFAAYQMKRLEPVLRGIAPNTTLPILNQDDIGHLPFCLPSLSEQRAIAAFLDRETGRIDTLIEKKERQDELLQEKRAALISHAVTKGLDPDVKMKDSGMEWLGEVPEDWKLKRIKQIASKIGSGKTPKGGSEVYSESGVTFLRSQNIHFDGLRLDDVVFIKESIDEEMFSTRVFSNDVLLNITGASLGRCSLVPDNFTPANVNQHVCIVRPIKKSIVPLFLYNVFASKVVQAQIFSWENGSSREGLTFPQIANLVIVAPDDLEEQHSIAAFLDLETGRIDTLTTKIRESTKKLREYRTALISAAVTGKIDVRNKET